ncbi:cytochrome P450 [Rhizophagus irregularis]|uniref:Cytochrome P450 n=1 Tax=Rhizophagus irregularis TaxID=588596 RepID=A0A2I1FYT4_9GLOM|nr:cytochrome P450 [Rhizophagus irregularis]
MLLDPIIKILFIIKSNILSIILLSIISYVINYYIQYFTRPSKLPGPFPIPIFGNLFQIGEDLVAAVDKFHEKYGDLYEFYVGNKRNVVISRPDLAEKVWGATTVKNTKFIMRTSYSEGVDELGLGTKGMVLNRNIETWNINRRFFIQCTSSPPFLREAIKLSSKINDEIFKYWKIMENEGSIIKFSDWMNALGTDIVVTTATGKRMSSTADLFNKLNTEGKKSEIKGTWENGLIFTESIYIYNESMMFMMLLSPFIRRNIPGIKSINKKFLDNRDWINNELEKMVYEKRKEIEKTPLNQPIEATILNLLITTNTERDLEKITVGKFDRPLTDDEISSILREVFTGGLDTTSNTLSFVTFYIAKNRDIYLKMRDEVLKVYGTLENPDITLESFDKLKYIEAVINEGIRIFPTLSFMARAAIEDVEFDGYVIKADTTVYTNLKVLSNNPKYFKDPEIFNPDRFLNDKDSMEKYTFLPFGYGARMCPGRIWAMVQMKTFLIKFVSTYDIELVDKDSKIKYKYATANRPVNVDLYIKTRK